MPDKPAWTAADVAADFASSPFMSPYGLEVVACDADRGELAVRAPFRPAVERFPGTGQWHGGPIAALIDIAGDYAAGIRLGRALPTIDLRIDYLRPAIATGLVFRAAVRRSGRTVAVVDVEVVDDRGALVALGRGVYGTGAAPDRHEGRALR
jgi:uncharacterized protein (TIGR00369 family)